MYISRHLSILHLGALVVLIGASSGCADLGEDSSRSDGPLGELTQALAHVPGTIANPGSTDSGVKSTFFFAGNWRKNFPGESYSKYYEYPTSDQTGEYTLHPLDSRHLGWSESQTNQDYAVAQIKAAGFNTVSMSYWGKRGTDAWSHWAPMHTSTIAHDQLFGAAVRNSIFIQPVIENYNATNTTAIGGNSPACHFSQAFPNNLGCVEDNIVDLVNRYLVAPYDPAWSARWLKLYTRDGSTARYAVNLMEVWSASNVTEAVFAAGFDTLAQNVFNRTGFWVGFTLDARTPSGACSSGRCPTAAGSGPMLQARSSVLAIQPFRSEIDAPIQTDLGRRGFKRSFNEGWVATGIPLIADLTGGYRETIFGGNAPVYGNDDAWRSLQLELVSGKQVGWTFSAWNGFTEGWAGMPTLQYGRDGTAQDTMFRWLQWTNARAAGDCAYSKWLSGLPTNQLYGSICEKWYQTNGSLGVLGAAQSTEVAGSLAGSRRASFQYGRIYWSAATGAREVHGAIYTHYASLGAESSWLGLPTSDQLATNAHCAGGQYNVFQHGVVDWCPNTGARAIAEPRTCRAEPIPPSRRVAHDFASVWNDNGATSVAVFPSTASAFLPPLHRSVGLGWWSNDTRYVAGDYNRDGRADILAIWNDGGYNTLTLRSRTGTSSSMTAATWASGAGYWDAATQWLPGDFNRDGFLDVASAWHDGPATSIALYRGTGTSFSAPVQWAWRDGGWSDDTQWSVGDFNLDGWPDLVAVWNADLANTLTVRLSTATGFTVEHWAVGQGEWHPYTRWIAGDFTGDGRTDMAAIFEDAGLVSIDVYRAVDGSFLGAQRWQTRIGGWDDTTKWVASDFDADGTTDIGAVWKSGNTTSRTVRRSTGTGFQVQHWSQNVGGWAVTSAECTGNFEP